MIIYGVLLKINRAHLSLDVKLQRETKLPRRDRQDRSTPQETELVVSLPLSRTHAHTTSVRRHQTLAALIAASEASSTAESA